METKTAKDQDEVISLKFEGDPIEYKFSFDFNAICDAEAEVDCNLLTGMRRPRELTAQQFRGLILAAMKPHHGVTLEEVGDLMSKHPAEVGEALAKVYGWVVLKQEESAEETTP